MHIHARQAGGSSRRLQFALAITASFMVVEIAGGLISGSLALMADAGHMAADVASLILALWADRAARAAAKPEHSYGRHRYRVLAAFVNGLGLLLIAAWILIEAVERLYSPPAIEGEIMLIVALAGLAANSIVLLVLKESHSDLNVRGAFLHVLADMLGSAAAVIAAVVVLLSGWARIDPLLSLVTAALIALTAWRFVREAAHVLLEGTPPGFDEETIRRDLLTEVPVLADVHHIHCWMIDPRRHMITLHARLRSDTDHDTALAMIQSCLRRHHIDHATIQLEAEQCPDMQDRYAKKAPSPTGCKT
jgi:cobalt-zinc-cadmium efflux system protein